MTPVVQDNLLLKPEHYEKGMERVTGLKPQRHGFNPEKKLLFLEAVAKNDLNIAKTCHEIGIDTVTFYRHIKSDPIFAQMFQEIEQAETDRIETSVRRAARSSDNFLHQAMYLKAHRPELYDRARRVIVEGHKLTGDQARNVLARAQGAVDAEIIKSGLDKEQRKALRQGNLQTETAAGEGA